VTAAADSTNLIIISSFHLLAILGLEDSEAEEIRDQSQSIALHDDGAREAERVPDEALVGLPGLLEGHRLLLRLGSLGHCHVVWRRRGIVDDSGVLLVGVGITWT
jgi:hypothetical protein